MSSRNSHTTPFKAYEQMFMMLSRRKQHHVPKKFVLVDIQYCAKNEEFSKRFVKKFDVFTDNKYDICIKWITKKVKQLFQFKSKNLHPSCVIYESVCCCQESYIGESVRNVEIRWQEHEDIQKGSEKFNASEK